MGASAAAVGQGVLGCFGSGCRARGESCTAENGETAALLGRSVLHAPHAIQRGGECRSWATWGAVLAAGLTMGMAAFAV